MRPSTLSPLLLLLLEGTASNVISLPLYLHSSQHHEGGRMERKEVERRTTAILNEYARTKQIFLDVVHEVQRSKDEQYSRALSFSEAVIASFSRRVEELVAKLDAVKVRVSEHSKDDNELVSMINVLNKVALRLANLGGAPLDIEHDPMLIVKAALIEDDTSSTPASSTPALSSSPQVEELKVEIQLLRKALNLVVGKSQAILEFKTRNAVEEVLNEARAEIEAVDEIKSDPFLMRAAEQRKKDLAAITNAQTEIEKLINEKLALTTALRKAEQDVVQMRLKMMERDSSMAVISKRIKIVESRLLEETTTSSKRIEDAERLAGEITQKYEHEVRRLRSMIESSNKEKEILRGAINVEKELVLEAKAETERTREQIEVAREDGYQRGRDSLTEELVECQSILSRTESLRKGLQENVNGLEQELRRCRTIIESRNQSIERLEEIGDTLRKELDESSRELAQRSQGPFGCAPPRTPASRGESENGILTVSVLVDDLVEKTAKDPSQAESAIRRLSTRLAKVQSWSQTSDKAKHPSMAARVSSAIHDLAAGMLAVASSGAPPPPSSEELKRRQSRRESMALESGSGSRGFKAFTDETVVIEAPRRQQSMRRSSSLRSGDGTNGKPPLLPSSSKLSSSSPDAMDVLSAGDDDEDFIETPSSSDDESDLFDPQPKTASIGCSCAPETVDRGIQAVDGAGRKMEASPAKKAGTGKLVKRDTAVTIAASSQPHSPKSNISRADSSSPSHSHRSVSPVPKTDEFYWTKVEPPITKAANSLQAFEEVESAVRLQIQLQFRQLAIEIENVARSAHITRESRRALGTLQSKAQLLKDSSSLGAFADLKKVELERSVLENARDVGTFRRSSVRAMHQAGAPEQRTHGAQPSSPTGVLSQSPVQPAVFSAKHLQLPHSGIHMLPGAAMKSPRADMKSPRGDVQKSPRTYSQHDQYDSRSPRPHQQATSPSDRHHAHNYFVTQDEGSHPAHLHDGRGTTHHDHHRDMAEGSQVPLASSDPALFQLHAERTSGSPTAHLDGTSRSSFTASMHLDDWSAFGQHDGEGNTLLAVASNLQSRRQVEEGGNDEDALLLAEVFTPANVQQVDYIDEAATVDGKQYNDVITSLKQALMDVDTLMRIKKALVTLQENTNAKLEICLNQMDDGGARLLSHASNLPMLQSILEASVATAQKRGNTIVVRESKDGAVDGPSLDMFHWFLLEGQRHVAKQYLPNGSPLAYEGRPLQSTQQAQDRLLLLLESLRQQKEQFVEVCSKLKKKRKKDSSSDGPQFLDSPDVNAALEGGDARGADEDDLEPLEDNALASRVLLSPRRDVRAAAVVDEGSESEDSDDSDASFVRPIIPKLIFPVNQSLKRMELDAIVQPLLRALKKKLATLELADLLSVDERRGLAIRLESVFENINLSTTAPTTRTDYGGLVATGLRASLSYETGTYLMDDKEFQTLHSLTTSFPKDLMKRVTADFNAELAAQLLLKVGGWWDAWSVHFGAVTDALEQRKTDQLRRLIELAEVLEEVLERNSRIDAPAAPRTPDIAEELHSRAPRRDDGLLRQLEHPSLAEFSLSSKSKVHQHSTMKSFSRGPALWKRDAMVSTLMNDLSNVSDSAAGGAGSSPKLTRTSPVPTVATLTPAPQYNPHAKKQVSKWDRQLPPLR